MPNNTYERKNVTKGVARHFFYTPLVTFNLVTLDSYDPYNVINSVNLGLNSTSHRWEEDFLKLATPIILKASRLISARHIYFDPIVTEKEIEAFEKTGWKVVNKDSWDKKSLFSVQLYNTSKGVDITDLTIDKLVGKTESKETKKILDNLVKEGESNFFTDNALANAQPEQGLREQEILNAFVDNAFAQQDMRDPGVVQNIVGQRAARVFADAARFQWQDMDLEGLRLRAADMVARGLARPPEEAPRAVPEPAPAVNVAEPPPFDPWGENMPNQGLFDGQWANNARGDLVQWVADRVTWVLVRRG